MNCPVCGLDASVVVWTERKPKKDRRRRECSCGMRWTEVSTIEKGSLTPGNRGLRPPLMEVKTPGNGTPRVPDVSESSDLSGSGDLNPISPGNPERGRARSNEGAEFVRLLRVFCERWERSNRRPYPVSAADKNQLGRFMKQSGNYIDGFAAICDRYLSDRRQFIIDRSANHRLAWLVTTGLPMYGGSPRESLEQYSARLKREHEARKLDARRPPSNAAVRDLIASLADGKVVAGG